MKNVTVNTIAMSMQTCAIMRAEERKINSFSQSAKRKFFSNPDIQ